MRPDRIPPHNLDAERGALGGILHDNFVLHDIVPILEPTDYYLNSHEVIYRAILDLYNRGTPIDAISLTEELKLRDQFKWIGGFDFIADIAGCVAHASNSKYHAGVVPEKSMARHLIQACID